jgi:hypothetical protein
MSDRRVKEVENLAVKYGFFPKKVEACKAYTRLPEPHISFLGMFEDYETWNDRFSMTPHERTYPTLEFIELMDILGYKVFAYRSESRAYEASLTRWIRLTPTTLVETYQHHYQQLYFFFNHIDDETCRQEAIFKSTCVIS